MSISPTFFCFPPHEGGIGPTFFCFPPHEGGIGPTFFCFPPHERRFASFHPFPSLPFASPAFLHFPPVAKVDCLAERKQKEAPATKRKWKGSEGKQRGAYCFLSLSFTPFVWAWRNVRKSPDSLGRGERFLSLFFSFHVSYFSLLSFAFFLPRGEKQMRFWACKEPPTSSPPQPSWQSNNKHSNAIHVNEVTEGDRIGTNSSACAWQCCLTVKILTLC